MDIMIDIETMGTKPNAAIASIGAVAFTAESHIGGSVGDYPEVYKFYKVINLNSCINRGLSMDPDTVYWWLLQSDAARTEIANHNDNLLANILVELNQWIEPIKPKRIWAWPPQFDLTILHSAYAACSIKPVWHWRDERDMRTLLDVVYGSTKYPESVIVPKDNVGHNALHDAWRQALVVQSCYQKLGSACEC